MPVSNPFKESGEFRIILVEASGSLLDPNNTAALMKKRERKKKRIKSKIDSGIVRPDTPPSPPPKIADTLQLNKDGKNLVVPCGAKNHGNCPKLSNTFFLTLLA